MGHPTKRRNLDYHPRCWHGWTASAWLRMDGGGLLQCPSAPWPFPWTKRQLPGLWDRIFFWVCCSIGTRIIPLSRAGSGKRGGMLRAGERLTMRRTVRESRGDYAAISLKSHGRSHYQDHCATGVKAVRTTLGELFTSGTWEQPSVKQNLRKEDPALSFLPLFDLPFI